MNDKKIKLSNSNSQFNSQPKQVAQTSLDDRANDYVEKNQEYLQRGFELSTKFSSLIDNKTLQENKGPLQSDLEKEVISKLLEYAIEMNTDEDQREGMGSIALATLLIKILLRFRDRLNNLEYKLEQQSKYIQSLEDKLPIVK